MSERIDLNALMESERQRIVEREVEADLSKIAASEAFKQQWRKLFALEKEQQRARAVAEQAARSLTAAGIPHDIGFHSVGYEPVTTGWLRKRTSTQLNYIPVARGWLLREALESPPVALVRPKSYVMDEIYFSAAVDEKGELWPLQIRSATHTPVSERSVDGIGSVDISFKSPIGADTLRQMYLDPAALLAQENILNVGPGRETSETATLMTKIGNAAIPYMARLLILHEVEPIEASS